MCSRSRFSLGDSDERTERSAYDGAAVNLIRRLIAYFVCTFTHDDWSVHQEDFDREGKWVGQRQRCNKCGRFTYVGAGPQ